MKLLVTGREGQLARALAGQIVHRPAIDAVFLGRAEADVCDPGAIRRAFEKYRPDLAINTAAYTAVDLAESEPERAHDVNAIGAETVAREAQRLAAPVIQVSTDYVFSGSRIAPWREDDPTGPVNAYGLSKLEGERLAAAANARHVILRTAWLYSPWGHNFLTTMLKLGAERDTLNVVDDQIGAPTNASDLARAILDICEALAAPSPQAARLGTFHFTNSGQTSWFGFAAEIFRLGAARGLKMPKLVPLATPDYKTAAKRPSWSVLDLEKIGAAYGINPRPWQTALAGCMDEMLGHT